MPTHIQTWLRRYLPAEAVSLAAAMFVGAAAAMPSSTNPAMIAMAAAWAETTAYYATMLLRERRAYPRQRLWQTLRNLVLEFGVAEALDSLLLRPTLMYVAGQLVSDARLGVLIGKIAADVVFYIPTVIMFELRQHYANPSRVPPGAELPA